VNNTFHVDDGLLCSNTVWTCRWIRTLRRNISPYSALKMETTCFYEKLVSTCNSIRYGVSIQETNINNLIAMRTSDPIKDLSLIMSFSLTSQIL
jgi:hypothetical protein